MKWRDIATSRKFIFSTTSIIQAKQLGTSMSKTLIEQANNMRELHQQHQGKGSESSIKILFPLVIFIFPTIFIIILLPPLINILNNMGLMP